MRRLHPKPAGMYAAIDPLDARSETLVLLLLSVRRSTSLRKSNCLNSSRMEQSNPVCSSPEPIAAQPKPLRKVRRHLRPLRESCSILDARLRRATDGIRQKHEKYLDLLPCATATLRLAARCPSSQCASYVITDSQRQRWPTHPESASMPLMCGRRGSAPPAHARQINRPIWLPRSRMRY